MYFYLHSKKLKYTSLPQKEREQERGETSPDQNAPITTTAIPELKAFIQKSVQAFGINSNGLCKYCSAFHVSLDSGGRSKSLAEFLSKTVADNKGFCEIITSVKLSGVVRGENKNQRCVIAYFF
jgi:hypothetical protein